MSQSFSTQDQVDRSNNFIRSVQKPACPNCNAGIRMCHHTPCIGTVDDIERLIDAGYAMNLMLDRWTGEKSKEQALKTAFPNSIHEAPTGKKDRYNPFDEDVIYLAPALVGVGGQAAPFSKTGTCNLLIDNKCSLHDKGLKPTQGQFACCKLERVYVDENGKQQDIDERIVILHTWNTQKGLDLIERWKKEVNYTGIEKPEIPTSLPGMLEALANIMKSHQNMDKLAKELPTIEDDRPVKTITYEKPY